MRGKRGRGKVLIHYRVRVGFLIFDRTVFFLFCSLIWRHASLIAGFRRFGRSPRHDPGEAIPGEVARVSALRLLRLRAAAPHTAMPTRRKARQVSLPRLDQNEIHVYILLLFFERPNRSVLRSIRITSFLSEPDSRNFVCGSPTPNSNITSEWFIQDFIIAVYYIHLSIVTVATVVHVRSLCPRSQAQSGYLATSTERLSGVHRQFSCSENLTSLAHNGICATIPNYAFGNADYVKGIASPLEGTVARNRC